MPMVKSIRRRKKARPGCITEHAKFKSPISDCNSRRVTFLRCRNSKIVVTHLSSLSYGNLASFKTVSNSMPTKERVVDGPKVFSGAMGTPKYEQNCRKMFNCC